MMQHEDNVRLRHMMDYSRKAVAMIRGRRREDLNRDEMLCLALTRALEVIGRPRHGCHGQASNNMDRYPGLRSLGCVTGSSTAMTRWMWISFGTSFNRTFRH